MPPRPPVIQRVITPSRAPALRSLAVVGVPMSVWIPPQWQGKVEGGALVLSPADAPSAASVRIYYEPGRDSLLETARRAAEYLKHLVPGAKTTAPRPTTMAGAHALVVGARTKGELERATVCVSNGVRYLAVEQLRRSAGGKIKRQEHALVASLRLNNA